MAITLTGDDEVSTKPLLSMAIANSPDLSEASLPSAGAKMHIALGPDSPGLGEVTTAIQTGQTENYKRLIADRDILSRQKARNDVLQSILQTDPSSVTPEVVNVVQGLSELELSSPDLSDIVEKKYAQIYTNTAATALQNDVLDDGMNNDPDQSYDLIDRSERAVYKNQVASKALSEIQKENDDRSFVDKAWDFGERMVPFVEWYQKQSAVGGDSAMVSSILPGSNLTEQYAYLAGLQPEEFKVEFAQALDELKSRNLSVAQSWVEGYLSYGSSDAVLDNILGLADVATILPAKTLGTALKGVVKGSMKSPLKVAEVAKQVGRYEDAAKAKVFEDIQSGDFFGQNIRHVEDLEASIPSITSPNKLIKGGIDLPQEAINRLKDNLIKRSDKARELLTDPNLIDRVTPDEINRLVSSTMEDFEKQYPNINKNVISVDPVDPDVGNVYSAKIVLGRRDGTLFESEKQADNYVRRYIKPITNDFKVTQVGSGFQVEITKNLDESRLLTDLRIETTQKTPEALSATTSWFRSPDYTLSKQNVEQRGVVVHTAEHLAQALDEITKPIGSLSKSEMSELEDLMIINRKSQEYFETFPDFEKGFFDRFKKNPTEKQYDAYFAYVQANDLDLVVRDLDWYKQKARLGIEELTVRLEKESKSFEGKVISSLPDSEFRYAMIDSGKQIGRVKSSKFLSKSEREKITQKLSEGWKLLQVADQNLELSKGQNVGILLVKDVKRDRIGVKNVDRKAGGHKVHEYSHYIKQPKLTKSDSLDGKYYSGDRTLFNTNSAAEAKEIAGLFEQARLKLKNSDPDAMKFIRDNLPVSPRTFMAKVTKGEIDLDAPFVPTKKGGRTLDTQNILDVIDVENSPLNLTSRLTGRYGGSRDMTDIDIIRSEGNSVFEVEPAPYLSPIDTLRISTQDMLSTRVLNDYSITTNQNFLREFGDILDGSREELLSSGNAFLVEPKFLKNADAGRVAAAKNVSRAYNGLMNYGSTFDRELTSLKEKFLSSVSSRLGPKGAEWVDERMLSKVKSAPVFMRSAAFHMKLGLFNVQQLFIKASSLVQVASIGGLNGLKGGLISPLFRTALLTNSPEVLRGVGRAVERTGVMRADEFEESMKLFKQSGFNSIGKDVAYLDDLKGPEIRSSYIGTKAKSFLKWGSTPFNEGERIVRIAAWNTAYLERKALQKGALSRRDSAAILQRAKDLTGNMTRDSNAAWQKGYGAVFTQFFGFQARIMEQMLGKKLSGAERLRLFTAFSAMYGVPVGMGSIAGVVPVRDIVTQTLSDMGIQYDDTVMEPFVDGFASSMIEFMTGEDTNLAARYGPGGLPTFYDLLRGDKEISDIFMGASGAIGLQTVKDSIPLLRGMASEWMDYKDGVYNLTKEDVLLPFRNISTVNNATQLWEVYNLGVWASKNGINLTEMDLPEGVLAALTGLQPSSIEESFTKFRSVQGHKEYIKARQKEVVKYIRQYMKMEDGPEREKLVRQAKAMMELSGMTLREKNQTWRMGADSEMLDDVFFEQYEKLQQRKGQ